MSPDDHQGDDDRSVVDRPTTEPGGSDLAPSKDLADVFFQFVAGRRDDDR